MARLGSAGGYVLGGLALVVATSGTAVAAGRLDGSDIQKRSIPGNRLELNSVTGAEVDESTLAGAPRRIHAVRLTSADVEPVIYHHAGLELRFFCHPSTSDTELEAMSTLAGAQISGGWTSGGGNTQNSFAGTAHSLSVSLSTTQWTPISKKVNDIGDGGGVGTLVYEAPGTATVISFSAAEGTSNGSSICSFDGMATTLP